MNVSAFAEHDNKSGRQTPHTLNYTEVKYFCQLFSTFAAFYTVDGTF
jgi:hypothetical protein